MRSENDPFHGDQSVLLQSFDGFDLVAPLPAHFRAASNLMSPKYNRRADRPPFKWDCFGNLFASLSCFTDERPDTCHFSIDVAAAATFESRKVNCGNKLLAISPR